VIRVLYFARLREEVGTGEESLALPAGVRTVGALTARLRTRGPRWDEALSRRPVLVAVNQTLSASEGALADGDEIAYFPPVTGG
jgi:molybdopterin synthase sulfur carrier subunit